MKLIVALVFIVSLIDATCVWTVAPSGTDNGGCLGRSSNCRTLAYPLNYMLNVATDSACQDRDYQLLINPGTFSGSNNTNLPLSTTFNGVHLVIAWATLNSPPTMDCGGNGRIFNLVEPFPDKVVFQGLTFQNCYGTDGDGSGAIQIHASGAHEIEVRNSSFINNRAQMSGGAIGYYSSSTTPGSFSIHSSQFTSNQGFQGGAVGFTSVNGDVLNITFSTFKNNDGLTAGGLSATGGFVSILNSVFQNNTSTNEGGAIALYGVKSPTNNPWAQTVLTENSGKLGGGLYETKSAVVYQNLQVSGNNAKLSGAGLYLLQSGSTFLTLSCINNIAQTQGGGIYILSNTTTGLLIFDNTSTISGNHAVQDGGGLFCRGAKTDFYLAAISGNTAPNFPDKECQLCRTYAGFDACVGPTTAAPTTTNKPTSNTPTPTGKQTTSSNFAGGHGTAIAIAIIIPLVVIIIIVVVGLVYWQYRRRHPYSRIV